MIQNQIHPYMNHLHLSEDLITTYEATRAGFVALALEKNRRATPYIAEARSLQEAASKAKNPREMLKLTDITSGLLTAAGLSDKAQNHLNSENKREAIEELIKNFLEPAGKKFIEELIFRFLLIRGDTMGGSMRNIGGALAQRKITRFIISTLNLAGIKYFWLHNSSRKWIEKSNCDSDIELFLRGLSWKNNDGSRTLIFNLTVPLVKNNVDMSLFKLSYNDLNKANIEIPEIYLAIGELKGGVDPAGADEHWKTARTALERIRGAFAEKGFFPKTFFIGAAIEKRMADEIWNQLQDGKLSNAANLNRENQVISVIQWLCNL